MIGGSGSGEVNRDKKSKYVKKKNRKTAKFKNLIRLKNYDFCSKFKNLEIFNGLGFSIAKVRLIFIELR